MSCDLEALFDEIDISLDSLERTVRSLSSSGSGSRDREFNSARAKLSGINNLYASIRAEYGALTPDARRLHGQTMAEYGQRIERVTSALAVAQGTHADTAAAETAAADGGIVTDGQIMASVLTMGAQDISSLDRAIRDVTECNTMADTAMEQLEADRERIEAINTDVSQIRNDLTLARRHITTIGRRLAGDRMFQILSVILVGVAVALIIFKFIVK